MSAAARVLLATAASLLLGAHPAGASEPAPLAAGPVNGESTQALAQAPEPPPGEAPPPGEPAPPPPQQPPPPAPPTAPPPSEAAPAGAPAPAPPAPAPPAAAPPAQAQPAPGAPAPQAPPPPPGPQSEEAAQAADEEEAAARALQRSLVQRGALLLPVWAAEVVPEFTYAHSGTSESVLVQQQLLGVTRRTNQVGGALTARLGLPWDLQVEATAPLLHLWRDELVAGAQLSDASGSGLGDPSVSLTRQLVRSRGARPDVLLTATWNMGFGDSPFDVDEAGELSLGKGYHGLGATLTAVKAADPLVFLGNASYTVNLSTDTARGRYSPGDTWGASGGTVLAVSPDTSLSFLLDFSYTPRLRLAGIGAPGTNETLATFQLGLATLLSRRTLLNIALGAGLTDDSPDFQFSVSVPLRL